MYEKSIEFSLVNQKNINSNYVNIESKNKKQDIRDLDLGSTGFMKPCNLCSLTDTCFGHNGKYPINYPIFKSSFKKEIEFLLKIICPECGLIKIKIINTYLEKINNNNISEIKSELKRFIIKNKKNNNKQIKIKCSNSYCDSTTSSIQYNKKGSYFYYILYNEQNNKSSIKKQIYNDQLYELLSNLPKKILIILSSNSKKILSPTDVFYYKNILVPSNFVRQPNVYEELGVVFDPFTTLLSSLIKNIKTNNNKTIQSTYDIIDTGNKVNPFSNIKKMNLKDLTNGTKKDSIQKNSIFGKKTENTARAVGNPGIKLKIGNVTIPKKISNTLTKEIYYNKITEKFIDDKIKNDPGYLLFYVKDNSLNSIKNYKLIDVKFCKNLSSLKYGDFFTIKLENGDYVTISRAPSIHGWNFIVVKIANCNEYSVIEIPTPIISIMNKDFDGDELFLKLFNNSTINIEKGLIMNIRNLSKHPITGTTVFGFIQDQQISADFLYQEENINKKLAYLIYGEYSFILKNHDKEYYTGKELISYIFPDNFTFKNVFENGYLILKNIESSYISPNSYDSIFNYLSQFYGPEYTVNIIDIFKTILQNFIKYFGISLTPEDILPKPELTIDIKNEIIDYINNIDIKIEKLINDLNDEKIFINSYNEICDIKMKNISNMNEYFKKYMLNLIKREYKNKNNMFIKCLEMKSKLTINDIINIHCFLGQKMNKNFPQIRINGKCSPLGLTNDFSITSSGFISSSILSGLKFSECITAIKEESFPQVVGITTETSEMGTLGKKIIKTHSELTINNDKFMVCNKHIVNFNPNFLKLLVSDICKVELYMPSKNFIWYQYIKKIFDDKIKQNIIQRNIDTSYTIIKKLDFYLNMYSEITTFYFTNKNNKEKKINKPKNYIDIYYKSILSFYNKINKKYYFELNDLSYILYILLIYLDPSGLIFKDKYPDINLYINENLYNVIFNKIILKLDYSLHPGLQIGYLISNTLQEEFTQKALSPFHVYTKAGSNVEKFGNKKIKNYIEITNRKNKKFEDFAIALSYDYNILEELKEKFEYLSLRNICKIIHLIKENINNRVAIYKFSISKYILIQKNIQISTIYKIIKKYCEICYILKEYSIYLTFNKNCEYLDIYLYVKFYQKIKKNDYDFNILKHTFKLSLWDGIHKGKEINTSLDIEESLSETLDSNNNIIKQKIYKLKFFVESLKDFEYINTKLYDSLILPIWLNYDLGGIEFMKTSTIGKLENVIKNENFNHAIKHFYDFKFIQKNLINIKILNDASEIIKQSSHSNIGPNSVFVPAAYNNKIDYCRDPYSSLLISQKPKLGTNYYNFAINANKFDKYKTSYKEKLIDENENIIQDF